MFAIIVLIVVILDQFSKHTIQTTCVLNETVSIVNGIFDITYVHNYGAAFSILQNKQVFLIIFTAIAMIAITIYTLKFKKSIPKAEVAAFALIVGGGLGNLIDRVINGYVVDFLNIHILPVFNLADISVCLGSALLIYSVMILEPKLYNGK